jgi:predicted metal-dependent phosphoesterase TrpH
LTLSKHVDLHTHSTASDGVLSPEDLVALARDKGLAAIALTDHDNTAGLERAISAGKSLGVEVVPGVEISADFSPGTLHILGLEIDPKNPVLRDKLEFLQQTRRDRNPRIARQLQAAGLDLRFEEVEALASGGQVGRPHFASLLLQKKIVSSWDEAFDKWLGKGKPGYVDKVRVSSAEAVGMIHAAGGLAVLAHPVQLQLADQALTDLVSRLAAEGLDAIEVYHSDHGPREEQFYQILARRSGLKFSGGSDYHGFKDKDVELGIPEVDYGVLEKLRSRSKA